MNINKDNKLHELSLYTNMSLNNISTNKEQNINTKNSKYDNNLSSTINRIKRKSSTMNYKQRELQERISEVQSQEAKIDEMERALKSAKNSYSDKLKNENKETSNIKVKIKLLSKKEEELETQSNEDIKSKSKDNQYEDENVISVIDETLKKIEQIKNQISIYKSKLMSLEHSINQATSKLESSKNLIEKDFINSELNFISLEGNIETGIIINIQI